MVETAIEKESQDGRIKESVGRQQPVGFEPVQLGSQGLTSTVERAENGAADRPQIGEPPSLGVRLDMAGPADDGGAEVVKVDVLGVDGPDGAVGQG